MPLYSQPNLTKTANGVDLYGTGGGGGGGGVVDVLGTADQISALNVSDVITMGLLPPNPAPVAGAYTNANVSVDALGRVTAIANGSTSVTSLAGTANQISASSSTGAVTLSLAPPSPAPVAGSYVNSSVTVDALGRVTAVANGAGSLILPLVPSPSITVAPLAVSVTSYQGTITPTGNSTQVYTLFIPDKPGYVEVIVSYLYDGVIDVAGQSSYNTFSIGLIAQPGVSKTVASPVVNSVADVPWTVTRDNTFNPSPTVGQPIILTPTGTSPVGWIGRPIGIRVLVTALG